MWLDAFKPKPRNIQNIGVTGVTGVTSPRKANEYGALAVDHGCNTSINQGVTGVTDKYCVAPVTPCSTVSKTRCCSATPPHKPNARAGFSDTVAPVTPVTPEKHNKPDNADGTGSMLASFDMEAVQQEIDAGYPEDLLRRVNNIAWRLITTRGYPFNEAIKAAALWVADNPPHADEAAFVDVMAMFKELGQ